MWMRRMMVTAAILVGPAMAMAQGAAPAIPEYTNDQRWGRLAFLNLSAFVTEVALGKSRGMTVEDIGKWLGDYYTATWAGGLDARQFAISMRLNVMGHPASRVELPTFTDSLVVMRLNTPELADFGPDRRLRELTLDEYRTVLRHINQRIADHVGVALEQRYDGDWLVLTMRNRYQAPRASDELRWNRAAFLSKGTMQDVIRFAKAAGKTPLAAGTESGKTWAGTWTTTDTPWRLFRGMVWNAMTDPNLVCEVQSASASMVRGKCNRPWIVTVRANAERTGVSVEDYEAYMLGVEQAIATSLAMTWNVQVDGDYRVITVSRR
jgi:hypothetical protein